MTTVALVAFAAGNFSGMFICLVGVRYGRRLALEEMQIRRGQR